MKNGAILSVVAFLVFVTGAVRAEFVPGQIYISDYPSKHCVGPYETYPGDRIWKVDPQSGEVSLFVELQYEWCGGIGALIFTPDGTKLRAAQFFRNRILEFDSEGTPTVLYDGSDGIAGPVGENSMAYDRKGNFYVAGLDRIVKFPAGSDVSEVYADRLTDPLVGDQGGSIAIDAAGDLYFATDNSGLGRIVRFQGPHNGSHFDSFGQGYIVTSMVSDSCGRLFAAINYFAYPAPALDSYILQYQAGAPESRALLAQLQTPSVMALDAAESTLFVSGDEKVFRVSTQDGSITQIAIINAGAGSPGASGMAVVPVPNPPYGLTPCPPPIPAVSAWGATILAILLLIGGKLHRTKMRI